MTTRRRLAMIAPLLGDRPGRIPDVFEVLGPLLARGNDVVLSSHAEGRVRRATDMALTVRRHRRDLDAVIVHLYSGRALAVEDMVSRIARRADLPLIGVLAGGGFPAFHRRYPRWVEAVLARFDALVAPSAHLGDWAAGLGHAPVVIPNPLDVDDYPFHDRARFRPRLFWMRAFHPIYRPLVALDVVERVRATHPDTMLTMAGPDKGERAQVEREIERRGLEDAVELRGFVGPEEKRDLLGAHDVFLNTPAVDNRPVSVVEAAASGLVVVSTDAGGIPALVADGQSALLAPVDDADALAAAVCRVVDDASLARHIAAGGLAVADEGRPDRVLAAWEALIERTIR